MNVLSRIKIEPCLFRLLHVRHAVAMKGDMDDHLESHSEMWYKCKDETCGWMYKEDEYQKLAIHCRKKHGVNMNIIFPYG